MTDGRLVLAIPTFRRSGAIAENLAAMIADAARLNVAVYVSDDSPDLETKSVVEDFARRYGNVRYRRNTPGLGHDDNLLETLLWPDADYVWLLGDALRIKPGQLPKILGFLADQDLVFVNSHSPDTRSVRSAADADALHLIRDALWHQTMTGTTIYHRRVCAWARSPQLQVRRNFPQLSVVLGYASARPATVAWFGEPSLAEVRKHSYWREFALDVFVDDWVALVSAHPAVIDAAQRPAVLKSHSARMRLFDLRFLLDLKRKGRFGWSALKRPHFWDVMHLGRWPVLAVLLLPSPITRIALRLKRSARNMIARSAR